VKYGAALILFSAHLTGVADHISLFFVCSNVPEDPFFRVVLVYPSVNSLQCLLATKGCAQSVAKTVNQAKKSGLSDFHPAVLRERAHCGETF
jgi:hypothetical protein